MTYLKLFFGLVLAMFLSACVSLSTIKTMQVMSDFDPLENDIANMVFGVQASPKLKVQPQTSKFTMTVQVGGDGPSVHRFALVPVDANDLSVNKVPKHKGKVLSLFGFSEQAKADLVEFQALLRDMKSKKTKNASLSVGVVPDFCKTEQIDNGREKFTVFMARADDREFLTLVDNMSVQELLKQATHKEVRDC